MDMLPDTGLNLKGLNGEAGSKKIMSYITIMDSMTDQEKDFPKILNQQRLIRIGKTVFSNFFLSYSL